MVVGEEALNVEDEKDLAVEGVEALHKNLFKDTKNR
jgi:hypothetical protein